MLYLFNKIKTQLLTLRFSILSIFIVLFITSTSLIIFIIGIAVKNTIVLAATELMQDRSRAIVRERQVFMRQPLIPAALSADLIKQHILRIPDNWTDNETNFVPYTASLLQYLPLVVAIYWADADGDLILSKKNKDGTISTVVINRRHSPATQVIIDRNKSGDIIKRDISTKINYDPRVRPWYTEATTKKKPLWTDVYQFRLIEFNSIGITRAVPVYENGQLMGVVGVDIALPYLSDFLSHQVISPNGFAFLVDKNDTLLAYPDKKPFTNIKHAENQMLNLDAPALAIIKESFHSYRNNASQKGTVFYTFNKKRYLVSYAPIHDMDPFGYLVSYAPIHDMDPYGWYVGIIAPATDFTAGLLKANIMAFGFGLLILALGIMIVSGLITRIIKPIKSLVLETEHIKNFNLDSEVKIKSRIKEIIYLKDAIQNMKLGLKLFQRYIPKTLVRQLIESREVLRIGGIRKELTVFFSDIEHFTTAAEKADPNLIVMQLCEYFEALSLIISKEKGTIDKYIGDAIMAFWGAPLINRKSCYHAAKAALACQFKLNELNSRWKAMGQPVFITRIGLHAGAAIVGNFGSSERLSYTALGDTVNIASRLQEINKQYKTKIIVSDIVYAKIKDKFVLRLIDCVVLEGRKNKTYLYELLGDKHAELSFDLKAYSPLFEKGFAAYQQQQWAAARSFFELCLSIYPADTITPVFINYCTMNLTINHRKDHD